MDNSDTPARGRRDKYGRIVEEQQEQQQQQQEPNDEQPQEGLFDGVLRWMLMFGAIQLVMQGMSGLRPQPQKTTPDPITSLMHDGGDDLTTVTKRKPAGATTISANGNIKRENKKPVCLWGKGTLMDLHVYVTDSSTYNYTNIKDEKDDMEKILAEWHEENIKLGSVDSLFGGNSNKKKKDGDDSTRNTTVTIPFTDALRFNETHLYAHVHLVRKQQQQQEVNEGAGKDANLYQKSFLLTKHRNRKKIRNEKNLLDTTNKTSSVEGETAIIPPNGDISPLTVASRNTTHDQLLLYAKPSLTLQIVPVELQFPQRQSIPPQFSMHMDWYSDYEYYPILYNSEFWIMTDHLVEVNGTIDESVTEMRIEHVPMWKWQLMSQMEQTWANQEKMTGEEDSSNDMFRTMLMETNPYLLAVTAIVSVLHTVFDILAFKNDISFFRGKKSMEGLSLRSMVVNTFFQVVILLYLADNETNFMVLMSNGVGLLIEIWKISKAVKISFEGGKIHWEEASSYKMSKTKEYDEIATSHLLFITMPLVAGYGLYSLVHQKHKGWYSWILNTLVGFIYMFGFVMMTPQLFINYKLQSVAHLNWRTMTYKSINTFIDDLFAFVIKMPIMHRLACLRDDVIFLVFCYQRYKYRTDYTRVNEFGQCAQPTDEMLKEVQKEQNKGDGANETAVTENADNVSVVRKRRGARDKIAMS
uniref:Cleft lip and palate transmembrane 1 n=1 Tax=Ditylum brightwellii TaxID=49249 RepID=A0A7S1YQU3_9STRA|mmetsp:Transcript_14095/g.21145  ORF Transcript_14095/g.21145 Transcript_14095/m.21145 type:complete len:697 (+) Transcript_14095:148-2238(+)